MEGNKLRFVGKYFGIFTGFLGNLANIGICSDDLGSINKYFLYDANERRGAYRMLPIVKCYNSENKEDIPVEIEYTIGKPVVIKHFKGRDRSGRLRDYLIIKTIRWVNPRIKEDTKILFFLSRFTDGVGMYEREVCLSPVEILVNFSNCHFHGLCSTDIEHFPLKLRYEYKSNSGKTKKEYEFLLPDEYSAFNKLFRYYFTDEELKEITSIWNSECRNSYILGVWDKDPVRKRLFIQRNLLIRWLNSHPDKFANDIKNKLNYKFDVREATQLP